uniref:Uncharacterized protein n=1 Tax=Rhizophora mucronata TaxID=61149 RepID=A0A2P2QWM5_RHIMU
MQAFASAHFYTINLILKANRPKFCYLL